MAEIRICSTDSISWSVFKIEFSFEVDKMSGSPPVTMTLFTAGRTSSHSRTFDISVAVMVFPL